MARRSKKYWQKRSEERMALIERQTPEYLAYTQSLFNDAEKKIQQEIERIIGNFAKNPDITYDEAKKILYEPLPKADIEALKKQAMAMNQGVERARAMIPVNAPAYKSRISRLEGIKQSVKVQLGLKVAQEQKIITDALTKAGTEMYYRTMFDLQKGTGIGFSFSDVTQKQIDEVLKHNWSGKHYSTRIWDNTEVLAERVKTTIRDNLVTGKSWRRSLNDVSDIIKKGGQYSAKRLLQTETAYVANEMEAESYEESGIEEYEFLATLDDRTSTRCQDMDGKKYKLKDRVPGVNYPPLHAHCRSTTVAVIEGLDTSKLLRIARDPETGKTNYVPTDMNYKEWKKSLEKDKEE